MAARTEREQRRLEIKAVVFGKVAGKALSRKTTGLDRVAKNFVAKQAGGPVPHDPELDHPVEFDRPID